MDDERKGTQNSNTESEKSEKRNRKFWNEINDMIERDKHIKQYCINCCTNCFTCIISHFE